NVVRTIWILSDYVDRHFTRHIGLAPGFAAVARYQNTRARRSYPDRFGRFRHCRDAGGPWIKTSVRKFQPSLRGIHAAIESGVSCCENRRFLSVWINCMDQRVDGVRQNQVRFFRSFRITGLADTECREGNRIELTGYRQMSIGLEFLQRRCRCWSRFAVWFTEMITSGCE